MRIGVDFGGTKIEAAALDASGAFAARIREPKPPSWAAATAAARASSFISGATASSRSSTATSQGRARAFSTARAFQAGR